MPSLRQSCSAQQNDLRPNASNEWLQPSVSRLSSSPRCSEGRIGAGNQAASIARKARKAAVCSKHSYACADQGASIATQTRQGRTRWHVMRKPWKGPVPSMCMCDRMTSCG